MSQKPIAPPFPMSAGSKAAADVSSLLRARNPLLWITTREEGRAERFIMDAAQTAQYEPRFWDCANGVTDYAGRAINASITDPVAVLSLIRDTETRQVWILRDLAAWLRDPTVTRALRSLARTLTLAPRDQARAVICLGTTAEVPPDLAGHAVCIDWPLPDRSEIAAILDSAITGIVEATKGTDRALTADDIAPNGTRDAAIDAAVGLTAEEAQGCYAKSLVSTRRIEPATVAAEKKRVIAREKVLEWIDPMPGGLDSVGGLEVLKAWLKDRRAAFTPAARAYGLPAPKGALLVGVPGCGKSLTAKAIAAAWGMPLLRLDMGALKSKFVGESEGNIRKALKVAETVAPCVLWLDEIEKALAGATQGAADGGTSADALGAVLSWMQDRAGSVFVVATANDVSALPPELLRKGRFDELFFVDLPTQAERAEIFRASLAQHKRAMSAQALQNLATAAQDFTGAEIAALIPDALYAAYADGARDITPADLAKCISVTAPLAKTAAEKITNLRKWAEGRTRNASATTSTTSNTSTTRNLDI